MVHVRNANGELRSRIHAWVRRSGELVHPERRSLHARSRRTVKPRRAYGNVSFQLLMRPTSCAATSWTFNFQVPLATSDEASTV